jgi:hypothetical protein
MHTPGHALLWEIWRKNRVGNLIVLAAIPVFGMLCGLEAHLRGGRIRPEFAPFGLVPMIASILWVFSIFAFTESDSRRGFTGIPGRLFTLPVRTRTIVTWLTLGGALAASGLYFAWAKLVFAPAGFPLPLWFPLAALATGIVFFQATVWGLASFPWLRALALVAGFFGFMVLNAEGIAERSSWQQTEPFRALTVLAFLPVAYAAALFGVQAERCGGWHLWTWIRNLVRVIARLLPRRKASFASAAGAQLWFEWRRKGWFLSLGLAIGIAGTLVLLPIVVLSSEPQLPFSQLIATNALFYPLLIAGIAGLGLAKSDFWSKEIALDSFQALRPETSAELVFAKLKTATLFIFLGCFFAGPLCWLVTRLHNWQDLWSVAEVQQKLGQLLPAESSARLVVATLAIIVLLWHTLTRTLSLALTGRMAATNAQMFVGGALFLTILWLVHWLGCRPEKLVRFTSLLYAICAAVLVWKLAHTLRFFRRAIRQGLLSERASFVLLLIWFAGVVSACVFGWLLWAHTTAPQRVLSLAVVWLFPNGALAQSVLNLASNRHR